MVLGKATDVVHGLEGGGAPVELPGARPGGMAAPVARDAAVRSGSEQGPSHMRLGREVGSEHRHLAPWVVHRRRGKAVAHAAENIFGPWVWNRAQNRSRPSAAIQM